MDFKIKAMNAHGKNQTMQKGVRCTRQIFVEYLLRFFFSHTSLITLVLFPKGGGTMKYIMYIFREGK